MKRGFKCVLGVDDVASNVCRALPEGGTPHTPPGGVRADSPRRGAAFRRPLSRARQISLAMS